MKRWGKSLVVGLFAMVMSMFWAVGCSELDFDMGDGGGDKLDAVSQSTISASLNEDRLTVYWGAVQLAMLYEVTFGDTMLTVYAPSTSAEFTDVQYTSGSLTISIVARAVGFKDSATTTYTFTPGGGQQSNKLTMPAGLNISNGTLSWTAVFGATSYLVSNGTKSATVTTNSINLAANGMSLPTSGSATFTVVAKAAGYTDSPAASYTYTPGAQTLATPTGLVLNNGTLSWTAVTGATGYTVSNGTKSATVTTNSINLAANGMPLPESSNVTYTVVATANGYNASAGASYTYIPSGPPRPQTLATPTGLSVRNGTLSWNKVANAKSYTVSDGTHTVSVSTNSIALATNGLTVPTSGSITYKVIAKASGYTDSAEASFTYTYKPPQPTTLAVPVALIVASGGLSWAAVENATSYVVSDGTTTKTVTTNRIDLADNGFTIPNGGSKTYTVIAKAAGYNDSPAASYTHTFNHTHTYNMAQWSNDETHHWRVANCGHSIIAEDSQGWGVHDFGTGNTCSVCGYTRQMQELGKYAYYGEYPQSLKKASVTVSGSADANGYYSGSDGAKYAKVSATPYVTDIWGDVNRFANDEDIIGGTTYYFKVEPIKWRVLETKNGVSYLLCDSIIDHGAFYKDTDSREIGGDNVYPNNYANSDIRTWLNGTFYAKAFSSTEKQSIQTTTVDNSAANTGHSENSYSCEDTQDKIFLPSYKEVHNSAYGYISEGGESDPSRKLLVSDYARAIGAYTMGYQPAWYGCGQWWLRSPMWDNAKIAFIGNPAGGVASVPVNSDYVGIAPAMRVTASALLSK